MPNTSTIYSSSGKKSVLAKCTFCRKTHLPSTVARWSSLRTISVYPLPRLMIETTLFISEASYWVWATGSTPSEMMKRIGLYYVESLYSWRIDYGLMLAYLASIICSINYGVAM